VPVIVVAVFDARINKAMYRDKFFIHFAKLLLDRFIFSPDAPLLIHNLFLCKGFHYNRTDSITGNATINAFKQQFR